MTYRFSLRTLLLAVAVFSCVFACLFLPGGLYVHLPLMFVCVLGVNSVRAGMCMWRDWACRMERQYYRRQLLVSTVLLAFAGGLDFPFFNIALRKAQSLQFAATQRRALVHVDDPIRVRDAARRLREQFVNLPPEQRRIDGNSDVIPAEIASLHPRYVKVQPDSVFVEMCCTPTDWFGLLVFPEGAAEIGADRKLADGIWYWETP